MRRTLLIALALTSFAPRYVRAIDIVLDYTLDTQNLDWFGGTPDGLARRAALDSAAGFLSAIITNDDWNSLSSLNESFSLSDIALSTINDLSGNPIVGTPADGAYTYNISTTNRSSVAANEYIIYVGAFPFGPGTSAHAKAAWDSNDYRNAAGQAMTEFNTWGGKVYFDSSETWYAGQNPGIDPTDNYGIQDPDKMPTTDISTDNWDWNTSTHVWKGYELIPNDPAANGTFDLYATGLHEMIHALGATSSIMSSFLDVSGGFANSTNVVAEYGQPVPLSSTGGHFDNSVQSEVWNSDGIISEVSLDPDSLRGRRKYLTNLDAALLRDLGYQVLDGFLAADFDLDGDVDNADLAQWEASYGLDALADTNNDGSSDGLDFLNWQIQYTGELSPLSAAAAAVPEPDVLLLTLLGCLLVASLRQR